LYKLIANPTRNHQYDTEVDNSKDSFLSKTDMVKNVSLGLQD
jgi:hypothetical protein